MPQSLPLRIRLEEVGDLVHEGVLVTDRQPRHPPLAHVGMVAVGDVHALPAPHRPRVLVVEDLQPVEVVQVPLQAHVLAVDLERVEGLVAAGIPRALEEAERPVLDPTRYFNGRLDAWGMFQDRFGNVVKRFTVEMNCRWEGDTGTLDEHFTYSDGEKQRRIWTLKRQADGTWQGTADDVVGVATGRVSGNALHWTYVLRLPVDGKEYLVDFDDWMWQMDESSMMNRSTMSKFGIDLGEVTLFFRKRTPGSSS